MTLFTTAALGCGCVSSFLKISTERGALMRRSAVMPAALVLGEFLGIEQPERRIERRVGRRLFAERVAEFLAKIARVADVSAAEKRRLLPRWRAAVALIGERLFEASART